MVKIIQISDTHLSPGKAHFSANWQPLAAWIRSERPDLVIHTGDVTVDGADVEDDLRYCAALMRGLGTRFCAVPGNHDVGDVGHRHQPVGAGRITRWQVHFGPDRWVEDIGDWRLIGLDSLLFGSGEPEENAQLAWVEQVMQAAGGRPLAWFLHRPLFLDGPDEEDTGYWSVKPQPRQALMALVRRYAVRLVASGHLHKAHQVAIEGTRYVWGPSSAFVCGEGLQPPMPGEKRLGAVRYEIDGDRLRADIVAVPGLVPHRIDDVIDEVYPRVHET